MLCITIASAQPRRESALLSLACIRKKGDIKYQLYCIVFIIYSTTSFNPFLLHPYTALSFRHLITKILKSLCSHLCPVSLEQTPTSVTDKNIWSIMQTHQSSPLTISSQVFHSKLKAMLFHKSYPAESSSSASVVICTLNIIYLYRLSAWISRSWPSAYQFVLTKRLWISWLPQLLYFGRCINFGFTILWVVT